MQRPNYLNVIRESIKADPYGTVYVSADFRHITNPRNLTMVFARLESEGLIKRFIRGVYYKQRYIEIIDEISTPDIDDVAHAIARNYGWKISPCGDIALNMLGLSTQVPAVYMYVSDGPYKEYDVKGIKISFKHTANKQISGLSYKSVLLVQAIKALGQEHINNRTLSRINSRFSEDEKAKILKETQHTTAWIYEVIKKAFS